MAVAFFGSTSIATAAFLVRVAMKRTNAAASKAKSLADQRALVRSLMEQLGWVPVPTKPSGNSRRLRNPLRGNVIQFPVPEE